MRSCRRQGRVTSPLTLQPIDTTSLQPPRRDPQILVFLQVCYKGPYKVVSRGPESFVLEVGGKFPIHRLKPYLCQEEPQPFPPSTQRSQTPDSLASMTTPTETLASPLAFDLETYFPELKTEEGYSADMVWTYIPGVICSQHNVPTMLAQCPHHVPTTSHEGYMSHEADVVRTQC